jgi:hypothetical protein
MKKVAILGAGPAGLMAAHAASQFGSLVSIFTQGVDGPTKSRLGGAQFLHKPIEGINDTFVPDGMLTYRLAGSNDGYQAKVYGEEPVPFVSMERVQDGMIVPAWRLEETYDRLWETYVQSSLDHINVVDVSAAWLMDLIEGGFFDLIVSTIPKTAVCLAHAGLTDGRPHAFVSQSIRIRNECAFEGEAIKAANTIWYDGSKNVSWYRTSMLFGVGSTEWGETAPARLPYDGVIKARKPLRTDCKCFDGRVLFAGRFGRWEKGALTHDAYVETVKALM